MTASVESRYRVGCTGWGYDDWVGPFYSPGTPAGEYLQQYARVFDLVEVDSSFYHAPSRAQVARWTEVTPPHFRFTVKFPGDITHKASLRGVEAPLAAFLESLEPMHRAGKLAALLLQLPESFRRDRDGTALREFLGLVPERYRVAVELRHASWWAEETYDALRARGASLVWSVNPYAETPPVQTAGFLYARLIGDRALMKFDRIQRDLKEDVARMVARLEAEGRSAREVYVLVNNHFMGFAPATAAIVREVLRLPRVDLTAAARGRGQRALGDFG